MSLTSGLQIPFGVQPVNPVPVDAWSGPYSGATEVAALSAANASIPSGVRFQSLEVRLIIAGVAYKYWYRDGITDVNLVEFASGSGGSGSDGAQGTQGAQGIQGITGADGAQGITGADGAQGITGADGAQGITGAQGIQGIQGAQGFGEQGIQGIQGIQGFDGLQGAQGTQGIQGFRGTRIASSETAPIDPEHNDLWFNTSLGILMLYFHDGDSGQWIDAGSGYTGQQGIQGTTGAQGASGTGSGGSGAQGTAGAQGIQGADGAQGTAGAQGIEGSQGAQGIQGIQGSQGLQGIQGIRATEDRLINGSYEVVLNATGDVTVGGNLNVTGNVTGTNLTSKTTGSWTVTAGTNTYSITVPINGNYQMWVRCNIPNGIFAYQATVSVTNSNVPVLGTQRGYNYTGGGSPILLTTMPTQIIGAEGTISTAVVSTTTANQFDFGINNASGSSQTVSWGYVTL